MTSHLHRAHHLFQPHGALQVIVVNFNPLRFHSRHTLALEFIERAKQQGAQVTMLEVAFGERPFEIVTDSLEGCLKVPLRTKHELWLKENSINVAVSRLPRDWQYVAWVDADVAFTNPHWVQETIQQLQHYDVVQMFEHAMDLAPDNSPLNLFKGFVFSVQADGWEQLTKTRESNGSTYYQLNGSYHPGFAWACTRHAWDTMGGLLDFNITGGADRQMIYALYGRAKQVWFDGGSRAYKHAVMAWQEHALRLRHNVGCVPGTAIHYWHGKKSNRQYETRYGMLAKNKFDPVVDLVHDWQGLFQLATNKPQLRDDLRNYFRSRSEDSIDV